MKRTPLKRKTRLSPVSKKRAKDMKEYSRLRKEFLEANPVCQVWLHENGFYPHYRGTYISYGHRAGNIPPEMLHHYSGGEHPPAATEVHHKAKRGKNYLNTDTWLAVCRANHERIERDKKWAREQGYLENI